MDLRRWQRLEVGSGRIPMPQRMHMLPAGGEDLHDIALERDVERNILPAQPRVGVQPNLLEVVVFCAPISM
jgi:hypothetical protein